MTRTAAPRWIVALNVAAIFALCAVSTQMLFLAFVVLGAYNDICAGIPFVLSLPAGWQPGSGPALPGLHELVSFAAFPGAPALFVLGCYVACMEHASAASPARQHNATGLPALGVLWMVTAGALWLWSLESVRDMGYVMTRAGAASIALFALGTLCLVAVRLARPTASPSPALNENAA